MVGIHVDTLSTQPTMGSLLTPSLMTNFLGSLIMATSFCSPFMGTYTSTLIRGSQFSGTYKSTAIKVPESLFTG